MAILVCCYLSSNLIPAFAALKNHGIVDEEIHLLWWVPSTVRRDQQAKDSFRSLVASIPAIHVHDASEDMEGSSTVNSKAERLSGMFLDVSRIYYPHDLNGDRLAQAMMRAFPEARRVCYGDSFGTVYSRRYYDQLNRPSLADCLRRPNLLRHLHSYPVSPEDLEAQEAALILPCDPGGDFLSGKRLSVISKQTVLQVIDVLSSALNKEVPASPPDQELVLATSNFTESQLCSDSSELALYRTVLQSPDFKGSMVWIKPHPGTEKIRLARLVTYLGKYHDVRLVDPSLYAIPLELIPRFRSTRLVSFSYSSISMRYLFSTPTYHALTPERIDSFFFRSRRKYLHSSNDTYLKMLRELESWNGHSSLAGTPS